jgi:hypothetical protein
VEVAMEDASIRNKIFISHATPADNDFTKWLSLKLIALGYIVWCDILFLDKGVDFWKVIEKEIRNDACRFLVVLSQTSNQSDGVLQEIAVASKVKKELNDEGYIIPLLIDENLSYSEINIELNRLNAVDFCKSWINGLNNLLSSFEENNIPKRNKDSGMANDIYQKIFLAKRNIIKKDEVYDSNWFSIKSLPPYLYFHQIKRDDTDVFNKAYPFPVIPYRNYICCFSEDIDYNYPGIDLIDDKKIIKIPTKEIINGKYYSELLENYEYKKFVVRLLNNGFRKMMKLKHFQPYSLSNRKTGFWFEKGFFEKDKIDDVLIVGTIKEKNWHFGISGLVKLSPFPILILGSHIFFTSNGKDLIPSKMRQLKLRIKQGKNWYNSHWREKLLSLVDYLADNDKIIRIPMGKTEIAEITSTPIQFISRITYKRENDNVHEEDLYELDDDVIFEENEEGD